MRIGIVHAYQTRSVDLEVLSSGYDNIAFICGGIYWNIQDARKEAFDLVLTDGTSIAMEQLIQHGRGEKWGKLFMIEEAGISVLNHAWYFEMVKQLNPDGFLVHSLRLLDEFSIFGKPVIPFYPPYPFKLPELKNVGKNPNRVCLYLLRFLDPASNFVATLEVLRRLPPEMKGVTFIDPPCIEQFKRIVTNIGLADRLEVYESCHWPDYLAAVADCKVFASMDNRHTYGRFDLDAAHVGSAGVGVYTEAKAVLFPDCLVDCTDIKGCVDLILRERERNYIVPEDRLLHFDHNRVKQKLLQDLQSVF